MTAIEVLCAAGKVSRAEGDGIEWEQWVSALGVRVVWGPEHGGIQTLPDTSQYLSLIWMPALSRGESIVKCLPYIYMGHLP